MRILFLVLLTLGLSACVERAGVRYDSSPQYTKNGPPPHAPAHGYRHKHHKHDMIYDSRVGAYIVVGWTEHYFNNDLYFRFRDGHWEFNVDIDNDRGWKHADDRDVPYSLRKSKQNKSKSKKYKNDKKDERANNKKRQKYDENEQ